MAKMFYSLDEAAQKLGVSPDRVVQMASEGKLQQLRDGDKLMFKREQVDAIADYQPTGLTGLAEVAQQPPTDSGPIPLVDTNDDTDTDVINVSTSDSIMVDHNNESASISAVSVFDADEIEPADPSAKTQIADSGADEDEIALENVGSGSGLLDLTRESDDTSLGAELLEEIYPAAGESSDSKMDSGPSASGVFEGQLMADVGSSATGLEHHMQTGMSPSHHHAPPTTPISVSTEDYDPIGDGLSGGMLIGTMVPLFIAVIVAIFALTDVPSQVTSTLAGNPLPYLIGFVVLIGVCGGVGFFVGKSRQL